MSGSTSNDGTSNKTDDLSMQITRLIQDASEYNLYAKFFLTTSDNADPSFEKLTGIEISDNAICLNRRNKIARLLMPKLYAATRNGNTKAARKITKHMAAYNEAYSLVLKRHETRAVFDRLLGFRKEYPNLEEYALTHNFEALGKLLRISNTIYRDFVRLEFPYRMLKEAKEAAGLVYKLGNPAKNIVFLVDTSNRQTEEDLELVRDVLLDVVLESGSVFKWDKFCLLAYSDEVIRYRGLHLRGNNTAEITDCFLNLRQADEGATFYDGLCAAFDEFEDVSGWETKWIFCVASGEDLEHVLQQLEQEKFFVYILIIALDVPSDHLASFAKIVEAAKRKPNGKGILLSAQTTNLKLICSKAAKYLGERRVTLHNNMPKENTQKAKP